MSMQDISVVALGMMEQKGMSVLVDFERYLMNSTTSNEPTPTYWSPKMTDKPARGDKSGVYVIENKINGHQYVGSASYLKRRLGQHRLDLYRKTHGNAYLQNAWNKYGEDAFVFRPILYCDPELLVVLEQRAMDVLEPEYNIAPVAGNNLGMKHSVETRARMSAACKRRNYKPLSEGHKANISAALMGRKLSDETKAKMSVATKGHRRNVGIKHTDERRAKQSAAMMGNQYGLGHKHTPEAIAKLSAFNKGNKYALGCKRTPETRAKMSVAQKLRRRIERESKT